MLFTRRREFDPERPYRTRRILTPPFRLDGQNVKVETSHRHLGVILDQELRFIEQGSSALAKGTQWVDQFRRIARVTTGAHPRIMSRFYKTVAIPRVLYGASVWLTPTTGKSRGSTTIIRKISRVQRQAAIQITGAMKTTSTVVLDAHANLPPFPLLVEDICLREAVRMTTLPEHHPVYKPLLNASRRYVTSNRSPLHELTHHFNLSPDDIETITPIRQPTTWKPTFTVYINSNKDDAINEARESQDEVKIFSDGSVID